MKKQTKFTLYKIFNFSLVGSILIPSFVPTVEAFAANEDPLTLTFTKVNDTTGRIQVTFGSGVYSVLLPNGSRVSYNTTFQVTENGVYDFVAYNSSGRPIKQQQIEVTGLDVDSAPITTAHGLYVKLNVQALDTVSGVDSYRYKLDNSDTWSSWITYNSSNSNQIQVPITDSTESFFDTRTVQVEIRDKAGNIRTTSRSFRVDHAYPEIETNENTIYTKTGTITIPFNIKSYFKIPEQFMIKEETKTTNINLSNYSNTILSRKPNLYQINNQISYTVVKNVGARDIQLVAIKRYTDFKGNKVELPSTKILKVVYDNVAPTGQIRIEADSRNEVRSPEVTLHLSFDDPASGVASVRIYEGTKEYYLTSEEIEKGEVTIPWTLNIGKDIQLFMDVTDKAGNKATFASNKVNIKQLEVSGFSLTDVVNPITKNTLPRNWPYDGGEISMIPGGSFKFKLYYDTGYGDPSQFNVNGTYKITMVDPDTNKVLYESSDIKYTNSFDENNPTGNAGFIGNFNIPTFDKNKKVFKPGTKIYLSSTVNRVEKSDGTTITANFENKNSVGNLIGVIGTNKGISSMQGLVRFNEKN